MESLSLSGALLLAQSTVTLQIRQRVGERLGDGLAAGGLRCKKFLLLLLYASRSEQSRAKQVVRCEAVKLKRPTERMISHVCEVH